MLVVTRSRLDWRRFEICTALQGSEEACQPSGLQFDQEAMSLAVPNMPWGGPVWRGVLRLRVPLHAPPPGFAEAIFMPRGLLLCGGRMPSAANGELQISPDGRKALIDRAIAGTPDGDSVVLEWELGSAACPGTSPDGWPPFIVAGEADTVNLIETILRKHDGADES